MPNQQENSPANLLNQAQSLFKQGYLNDSKKSYQKLLQMSTNKLKLQLTPSICYQSLLNLSTIYIQQNDLQSAASALEQAIRLDPTRYEAFYNLALTYFYKKKFTKSVECLKLSLSVLYLNSGIATNSLKDINKSISLNSKNPKAYLNRALLYEKNKKIKLSENEYERITFQLDEHQFTVEMLTQIYAQKTMFYRRIGDTHKMEENLVLYHKNKALANYSSPRVPEYINALLQQATIEKHLSPQQQSSIIQSINDLIKQVQSLIISIYYKKPKDPLKSVQTDSNSISQQKIHQTLSHQKIQNVKLIEPATKQLNDIEPVNQKDQEIDFLSNQLMSQKYDLNANSSQNPSLSIDEYQDSELLDRKIQKLQKQIQKSGGIVPEAQDLQENLDDQNFFDLELEIQKTIEQSKRKKIEKILIEEKNSNKENSSEQRSSFFNDRDSTVRSRNSQCYEISLDQIKFYKSFDLQIRSLSIFDQMSPRKQAFAVVNYCGQQMKTDSCKSDKLAWNNTFRDILIQHQGHQLQTNYEISVKVYAKQRGWMSWSKQILLGQSVIMLTQKGGTKCTLENEGVKIGNLYYKIKLYKFEQLKK